MKNVIILDLDGTISNCDHRQELAEAGDWDGFNDQCHLDEPYPDMVELINALSLAGKTILGCTGRMEKNRTKTDAWFVKNGVAVDRVLMRPDDEFAKALDMKIAELEKFFGSKEEVLANVLCVFEDSEKLVVGFRDYGLTVCQVREGKF